MAGRRVLCPLCSFADVYEPKFQVALTHRNWTGGLLPVNASSYILGASIQPLAWLCVGCSGLVRVYQACAVSLMVLMEEAGDKISSLWSHIRKSVFQLT